MGKDLDPLKTVLDENIILIKIRTDIIFSSYSFPMGPENCPTIPKYAM